MLSFPLCSPHFVWLFAHVAPTILSMAFLAVKKVTLPSSTSRKASGIQHDMLRAGPSLWGALEVQNSPPPFALLLPKSSIPDIFPLKHLAGFCQHIKPCHQLPPPPRLKGEASLEMVFASQVLKKLLMRRGFIGAPFLLIFNSRQLIKEEGKTKPSSEEKVGPLGASECLGTVPQKRE